MKRSIILMFLLGVFLSGPIWAEKATKASSDKTASGSVFSDGPAPVVVWNREITVFRVSYEKFSPADRARNAAARIQALKVQKEYKVMVIKASADELKGFIISTDTGALFALLPGDADPESGETLEKKAQEAAERLEAVLDEHAKQMRLPMLLRGIGLSVFATLIYILVVWVASRIKNMALKRLDHIISEWRQTLSIAGIDIAPVLLTLERFVIRLSGLAVFLMATYIWLTFCLSRFFFTAPWGKKLGAYLIGLLKSLGLGIAYAVPGLFTVVVIFWLTRIITNGVSRFFLGVEKETIAVTWLQPESAKASRRIVVAVIWIFALTVAYPYIPGSGSEAFKGISVFAGLMLSLGSSGFVNQLMSGLVIVYSGALRVGDYVRINNIEGTVQELGSMSTKIATTKKEFVAIPNGVAISSHIVNYSRLAKRDGAIISTTITIGYDTPWRQVHALLKQAAEKTPGVRDVPAPDVLQRALSDFYVEYELRVCIDEPMRRLPVLSLLHGEIQDAFNAVGVQIMSPNFVMQPEEDVLVPKNQWYTAPAGTRDDPDTVP